MRIAVGALVCAVAFVSCTAPEPRARRADPPTEPRPALLTLDSGGKRVRGPGGIDFIFEAKPRERTFFQLLVRDLVRVDVWKPLVDGLHWVELETHRGAISPAGIHLADAIVNHGVADGRLRTVCDIRFYPRAIKQELRIWRRVRGVGFSPRQWRDYNENGVFDEPLPTKRQFWASILAHELSHCLTGPHGERAAQGWEYRTMRRLRRR